MLKSLLANRLVAYLVAQVGPVPGAIQSHLNVSELLRIALTALVMGGGSAAVLPALLGNLASFVNPLDVAMVTAWAAAFAETARRLGHGLPAPTR
jgi:hypothetical protein